MTPLNPRAKIAGFAVALAGVFAAAAAVGSAVGPLDVAGDHGDDGDHSDHGDGEQLGGLAIAVDGYRLVPHDFMATADEPLDYAFHIVGPDGEIVTDYDETHERDLHLIAVSRNLVDFLHEHPTLDEDGTWSIELPPLPAGSYRVYADFQPAGGSVLTLAADLTVSGSVEPVELPETESTSAVGEYEVGLDSDPVADGVAGFTVTLDGEQVAPDPYLGAAGHLVVIRAGDLGYLHVHPAGDGELAFAVSFPTEGTYRMFLDFAHGGEVQTASFTVEVDADHHVQDGHDDHDGHDEGDDSEPDDGGGHGDH